MARKRCRPNARRVRFYSAVSRRGSAVDWLFRSRRTGRITIAQRPNFLLLLWLGITVLSSLIRPPDDVRSLLRVLASAALVVWAGDEIFRGVNPWRRMLGAGVLTALAVSWWTRS